MSDRTFSLSVPPSGNVISTGETAGYASALCHSAGIDACQVPGAEVRAHMCAPGYEL